MSKKNTSPKKKQEKIVRASDIIEEVILVEDPDIQAIQEETISSEDIVDDGWGEMGPQIRMTQLGEAMDDTTEVFEELEQKQMQKVLGNKTITYTDDDDGPRQVWNEKYFEE